MENEHKEGVYLEYYSTGGELRCWDLTVTSSRQLTDKELQDHLRESAPHDVGHGIGIITKIDRYEVGKRGYG